MPAWAKQDGNLDIAVIDGGQRLGPRGVAGIALIGATRSAAKDHGVLLFQKGQRLQEPAGVRKRIRRDRGGIVAGKASERIVEIVSCDAELFEVVGALDAAGSLAHS